MRHSLAFAALQNHSLNLYFDDLCESRTSILFKIFKRLFKSYYNNNLLKIG